MKQLSLALAALAALAGSPSLAQAAAKPTKAERNDAKDKAAVEKAFGLIAIGSLDQAMSILDGVIARQTAAHADETRRIYCARSLAESLAYMLEAAAAKQPAVALDQTWADALFYKGFVLLDLRRYDEAALWYEKALALSPSNARYLAERGEIEKARRDWPAALATFQRAADAASLSPEDNKSFEQRRAWRGISFALVEMNRLDEAETWLAKCLALDPGDEKALGELAYIRQQRAKGAIPKS